MKERLQRERTRLSCVNALVIKIDNESVPTNVKKTQKN